MSALDQKQPLSWLVTNDRFSPKADIRSCTKLLGFDLRLPRKLGLASITGEIVPSWQQAGYPSAIVAGSADHLGNVVSYNNEILFSYTQHEPLGIETKRKQTMRKLASLISGTGFVLLLAHASAFAQGASAPKVADAKPGDVRAYITGALQAPMRPVIDQAKQAIGKNLVIEFGGARGNLESEILAGNGDFEVAVLLPDVDEKLLAAGKIKPGTYPIAHLEVAFGIRGNATVDLSTPEAIKKTLLAATSVKYAPTGAGAPTATKILNDLHIADQVKDNSKARGEVPLTGNQYEINIYPQSEIIANKELKNLGPVIKDFQVPLDIEATIDKNANDEAGAKALIKWMQGPALDTIFKENGFQRAKGATPN